MKNSSKRDFLKFASGASLMSFLSLPSIVAKENQEKQNEIEKFQQDFNSLIEFIVSFDKEHSIFKRSFEVDAFDSDKHVKNFAKIKSEFDETDSKNFVCKLERVYHKSDLKGIKELKGFTNGKAFVIFITFSSENVIGLTFWAKKSQVINKGGGLLGMQHYAESAKPVQKRIFVETQFPIPELAFISYGEFKNQDEFLNKLKLKQISPTYQYGVTA